MLPNTSMAVPLIVYLGGGQGVWRELVKEHFFDVIFLDFPYAVPVNVADATLWHLAALTRADVLFLYVSEDDDTVDLANVMFELGYAFAMGKTAIVVNSSVLDKYFMSSAAMNYAKTLPDGMQVLETFLAKYSSASFDLNSFNGLAKLHG